MLDYKDALTRMLFDFVDIFNMVEILSVNVCVEVGSFVSEYSSTERAIQTFLYAVLYDCFNYRADLNDYDA